MSHVATNWALSRKGLKPATKIVLIQLADRQNKDTGQCNPKQERLAADCEMSRSTLNRHLDELERRGLITRHAEIDARTKRQRPTNYVLNVGASQEETVSENDTRAVSQNETDPCPILDESRVLKSDTKNPVREPGTRTRAFARFWAVYPSKVGKQDARKKFDRAVANGADIEVLIRAAIEYSESDRVKRGFIANPATWLNQGRWEDEPARSQQSDRIDKHTRWDRMGRTAQ